MLGHALAPVLEPDHQVTGLDIGDCDIRDPEAVRNSLRAHRPELVVHLAAYTDVDGCELDWRRAEETNGIGTRNVAQACQELGATMLYMSTDYVFDGKQEQAYSEQAPTNPINAYGRSKLLGEQHLRAILDRHFIVRTSWLFGPKGRNFVSTILELAGQQRQLRVVDDQRGSPTYTRHLASKLAQLLETKQYGIYHITGSGSCSWFEFAQAILELGGFPDAQVVPISSDQCARPARRPANSVLDNRRLSAAHLDLLPHWREGLRSYLQELERDEGRLSRRA
jgi:dTDP-4-dehydrorhamnose reductase